MHYLFHAPHPYNPVSKTAPLLTRDRSAPHLLLNFKIHPPQNFSFPKLSNRYFIRQTLSRFISSHDHQDLLRRYLARPRP